ncbi:MAG: beta-N-acetylhexosaminidase [Pseudomonadota bacterium]
MALGPLMIDIEGVALTPADRDLLRQPAVGGVILFKRNFSDPEQLRDLIAEIKDLRRPALLVGVDQEGGRVQRFGAPFTALPPLGWFGLVHKQDPTLALDLARQTGWLLAAELLSVGVDLSFAPVLDLHHGVSTVIGDRSLHRSPDVVVALATRMMHGMKEAGMSAVGKHFPGHGAVVADSHFELPTDRREYSQMFDDISVFERMIAAGLPAVMTAHVVYSALDPMPASFSSWWQKQELRQRLGFSGAIVSDDLTMKATGAYGTIEERADLALGSGTDLVLICNDRPAAERAVAHLSDWRQPASMTRLARLRGGATFDIDNLSATPEWQAARAALDSALQRESGVGL